MLHLFCCYHLELPGGNGDLRPTGTKRLPKGWQHAISLPRLFYLVRFSVRAWGLGSFPLLGGEISHPVTLLFLQPWGLKPDLFLTTFQSSDLVVFCAISRVVQTAHLVNCLLFILNPTKIKKKNSMNEGMCVLFVFSYIPKYKEWCLAPLNKLPDRLFSD